MDLLTRDALRRVRRWAVSLGARIAEAGDPARLVLTWHRIAPDVANAGEERDPARLSVPLSRFAAQIAVIAAEVPIIPLDRVVTHRGHAVALTFDDGYASAAAAIEQILAPRGIPVTMFVTSGFVDRTTEAWWDALEPVAWSATLERRRMVEELVPASADRPHEVEHWSALQWYQWLGAHLHRQTPAEADAWIARWQERARLERRARPTRIFLSTTGLQRLAALPGVTIGAHTRSHPRLSHLAPPAQRDEIHGGAQDLAARLARPVTQFAYPYGSRGDIGRSALRTVRQSGFVNAWTTDPGQVHRWSPALQLRRITMRDWDAATVQTLLARGWTTVGHWEATAQGGG
jgi:peptidoglycan/xylan/chitin deacetylase (PgdA/CDA1 family)